MSLLNRPAQKKELKQNWKRGGFDGSLLRPSQLTKPAPCGVHCPAGTDVRGALALISQREKLGLTEEQAYDRAWGVIVETNPLPASLGRICPHPCEQHCNRQEKDGAVSIGALERFLGDWGLTRGLKLKISETQLEAPEVAVVGSGPAGLSCAYHLARRGYKVSIFESAPLAGGMLRYGVPSYRLSRDVLDAEIARLLDLGITLHCGARVGSSITMEELRRAFAAVFVAIGAHQARALDIPGVDGGDVLSGVDFLRRANSGVSLSIGPRVVVVGDGQTAIDVARVANRFCASGLSNGAQVTLLRAHEEREENLLELEQEGIRVLYELTPVAIERNKGGAIQAVVAQKARLAPSNRSGVRLPIRLEGGECISLPAETVIAAVSQVPDWQTLGLFAQLPELEVDAWCRTKVAGVWSGGDNLMPGIAVQSISHGLCAAESIHATLTGSEPPPKERRQPVSTGRVKLALYDGRPRSTVHKLTPTESLYNLEAEIEQGIVRQQVGYEAKRCLSCGTCFGCERCWMYCTPGCFTKTRELEVGHAYFTLNLSKCDGCRKCADECPCGFIEMN